MHPVSWRRSEYFYWLDGTFNWIRACLLDVNEVVKSCKAYVKSCKLSGFAGNRQYGRKPWKEAKPAPSGSTRGWPISGRLLRGNLFRQAGGNGPSQVCSPDSARLADSVRSEMNIDAVQRLSGPGIGDSRSLRFYRA
jgi:hypothetical protein